MNPASHCYNNLSTENTNVLYLRRSAPCGKRTFMTKDNRLARVKLGTLTLFLLALAGVVSAQQRRGPGTVPPNSTARTLTILTEPNAIVWLDEIRRGTTDAGGALRSIKVSAGAHTLRVRA